MKNSNKPFSFEEFKEVYSRVPRLCVDLVIRNSQGTLLTLRSIPPSEGKWHLPGGTVFMNEKLVDAVLRVAQTELGIKVSVEKLLGYIEFPDEDKVNGFGYPVSIVFLCRADSDDFQLNDEASDAKYFKVPPENTIPQHKEFIESLEP